jgi:hypothetical protein
VRLRWRVVKVARAVEVVVVVVVNSGWGGWVDNGEQTIVGCGRWETTAVVVVIVMLVAVAAVVVGVMCGCRR